MDAEDRPMPSLERAESLGAQAYRAVREHIAIGALAPGEAVNERTLALRLGVSPTPVREALRRLEDEGLIARQDRRKSTVVSHSPETLRELIYVEVTLRAAQARFATPNMTEEILGQLDAIVDEIEHIDPSAGPEEALDTAAKFDQLIARTAANSTVNRMIENVSIFRRVTRARSIQRMWENPERLTRTDPLREHREIIAAFRRADPELVEQAMRNHLLAVMDYLLNEGNEG